MNGNTHPHSAITEGEQAIIEQLQFMADMNFSLMLMTLMALGWIAGHQR